MYPNRLWSGAVEERYNHTLRMQRQEAGTMELEIKDEKRGGLCVFALTGEIDVYTAPRLKERLVAAIDEGCSRIILEMNGVSFIDSSGLGVLVSALRRAREKDGGVRIVCVRDNILKIFRITGLDKVFPIFSDIAEAEQF